MRRFRRPGIRQKFAAAGRQREIANKNKNLRL
jgi:hypothetical protein